MVAHVLFVSERTITATTRRVQVRQKAAIEALAVCLVEGKMNN